MQTDGGYWEVFQNKQKPILQNTAKTRSLFANKLTCIQFVFLQNRLKQFIDLWTLRALS